SLAAQGGAGLDLARLLDPVAESRVLHPWILQPTDPPPCPKIAGRFVQTPWARPADGRFHDEVRLGACLAKQIKDAGRSLCRWAKASPRTQRCAVPGASSRCAWSWDRPSRLDSMPGDGQDSTPYVD